MLYTALSCIRLLAASPLDRQELAQARLKERVLGKLSWAVDHIDTRVVGAAMVHALERLVGSGQCTDDLHDQVYVVNTKEMREIEATTH